MASPARVDGGHLSPKNRADLPIAVGLKWDWSGIGVNRPPCNLLTAQRLSIDYILLKSPISEKRQSGCDTCACYCHRLCAAMATQYLFLLCTRSDHVFRQLRETVRARVAQADALALTAIACGRRSVQRKRESNAPVLLRAVVVKCWHERRAGSGAASASQCIGDPADGGRVC